MVESRSSPRIGLMRRARSRVSASLTRMRRLPFGTEVGTRTGMRRNALAAIRAQHSFHGDLITGPGFRYVCARVLQHRGVSVFLQFELEVDTADGRRLER